MALLTTPPVFLQNALLKPSRRCPPVNALPTENQSIAVDPEGLFKDQPKLKLFKDTPTIAQQPMQPDMGPIVPLEPAASDNLDALRHVLTQHMPVNLDYPGLQVHHLDPVVLTVDGYFSPAECEQLITAAQATGLMEASKVGSGNVQYAGLSTRRTSSSMLINAQALEAHPALQPLVTKLHERGQHLFATDNGPWGAPGQPPVPGQYCYEALQVAEYQQGQYFREHDDAFPVKDAIANGFQRQATLLVYLNNVPEGGATRFTHLNLSVRPKLGRALVFFPAYADGSPDHRTLHSAEDAVQTKWVTQQWIARGMQLTTPTTPVALPGEQLVESRKQRKKPKAKKGFGK